MVSKVHSEIKGNNWGDLGLFPKVTILLTVLVPCDKYLMTVLCVPGLCSVVGSRGEGDQGWQILSLKGFVGFVSVETTGLYCWSTCTEKL